MILLAAGLIGWAAVVHLIDPVASTLWVSDAAISGGAWLVNPWSASSSCGTTESTARL